LQDFEYAAVKSIDEAVSLLRSHGEKACVLSGGTDLLVQLREGRKSAGLVVDIKRIPEVNQLVFDPQQGLVIGACVPCLRICDDPLMMRSYPGLVDALSLIGGTQIQGRASVGGNLCNASPAADSIPALIVHHALAVIAGPEGERELPVEDFCTGPGQNALKQGELLVAVRVPPVVRGGGAGYLRFIPRNEMDIAVVGAGASVVLNEEKTGFVSARISLGAVAPTPLLVREAGDFLAGRPISPDAIQEAARLAGAAARPIADMRGTIEQRRHLAQVLVRRALHVAIERARGLGGNGRGQDGD
jgi:carbon-monoxide dehydrogenase medium subunit